MEKIKKYKKILLVSLIIIIVGGCLWSAKVKKEKEERLSYAIELLNYEKKDKQLLGVDFSDNTTLETIKGRTDLIIETLSVAKDKEELLHEAKYDSTFERAWEYLIDFSIEYNDKMNMVLASNDYKDIEVLTYVVDRDDEILIILYDGRIYYDISSGIDRIEELEEKFDIKIDLEK